jgi:hypothetical protein
MTEPAAPTETPYQFVPPAAPALYLLIARYSHARWMMLDLPKRQQAHQLAEECFPYGADSRSVGRLMLKGVLFVRTFYSGFHRQVPAEYRGGEMEQRTAAEWAARDQAVEALLTGLPRNITSAEAAEAGLGIADPCPGWVAAVYAESFVAFVAELGGEDGPLWNMYDIEVIPLNDDPSTNEVYQLMTPVHWN